MGSNGFEPSIFLIPSAVQSFIKLSTLLDKKKKRGVKTSVNLNKKQYTVALPYVASEEFVLAI